MTIKTYSPADVAVIVAGRNLENRGDTFVTVSFDEDTWMPVVGSDGDASRAYNANRMGTVVITLKQTADDNLFLSGLISGDAITKLGTFPFLVKDNLGNSIHSAAEAWIQKVADAEYGKEVGDRQWTIRCAELISVIGGSF
jgi:hypothetical protein